MRAIVLALTLATLAPRLAGAGTILFATEASQNAIDGFCVGPDGTLVGTPKVRIGTGGPLPRRLVVKPDATGKDGVLYAVEDDRVEAFRIGVHGGLFPNGSTRADTGMHPLDVAVSDDGRTVYVPHNGSHRIAAFPLDAAGRLPEEFQTCVNGPVGPGYQRLVVRSGLLYVTMNLLGGRLAIFPIAADGSLPVPADMCRGTDRGRQEETCPLAERRKLLTPSAFVISDADILYVESLATRRILAFQLMGGLFEPAVQKKTGTQIDICVNEKQETPEKGPFTYQHPLARTSIFQQYHDLALNAADGVVYGSQFTHGRVDAYRIKTTGKKPGALTKHPSRRTREDPLQSPVGLAVSLAKDTLYVAGGELDRVRAFRLRKANGIFAESNQFSETDERKGSFPNAVAVAELSAACEE